MPRSRASDLGWSALIVAAVVAAYANSFHGVFQFDDWNVIVRDPRVQSLAAWWSGMPGIRPLLKLTYAIDNGSGLGLAGFHAFNLAVHAGNALLVRALLVRLASRRSDDPHRAAIAGSIGALLFALHPVQTEAVTYVSGRSTSLSACFALASVVAWLGGSDGREGSRRWLALAVSPALLLAALCVKETAVVVPAALLLVEITDVRRPLRPAATLRLVAPHLAVIATGAVVALSSSTYRHLLGTSLRTRGVGTNLLTQVDAVFYLAGQLVRFDRLNADPRLAVRAEWTPVLALQATILVALAAAALWFLRRRPGFALGTLWSFVWLAPTNSLVARLDVANDRQLYVALIGPVWLLVSACVAWRKQALVAGGLLLAAVLGMSTATRNTVYESEIAFWEDVTAKSPHNARAFNNLGYAYALACRRDDARSAFREAMALDPTDFHPAVNLGLLRQGALPGVDPSCGEAPGAASDRPILPKSNRF